MRVPRILAIVLAGGKGSRLEALTDTRPKPTLPIGGSFALIDVSLSNLVHAHISDVWVVEQFRAGHLNAHLSNGRPWDLDRSHGGLVMAPPFEGGHGEGFAEGNADSLARQLTAMREFDPEHVLVLSADHLYRLNYLDVLDTHLQAEADLTVVTTQRSGDVSRYGVVDVNQAGQLTGFEDKPEGRRDAIVLTEVFLYRAGSLFTALDTLLAEHNQLQDYGDELLPHLLETHTVVAHELDGYWMDLGTLQSYWTANLHLVDGDAFSLDDPDWPMYSAQPHRMPARLGAFARVTNSLVAGGSTVHGQVEHSVIGVDAEVADGAVVRDSVLLEGAVVQSGVDLVNCIVDAGAQVTGPGQIGQPGFVTLIGADGGVAVRKELDDDSPLPRLGAE
ncbi:NTP transferase domain-containing protein [Tessaracoccus sp. SD287]|uniref:glucose-1-phosphate adenylyltransferase family protein n=1 Tax=Tessaracoccus sp. SD287 TaxID=2782008 RepID=UPI001A9570A3|nr:NTP transferase domain-containing protein [Tessaracoccus sp. SD287]